MEIQTKGHIAIIHPHTTLRGSLRDLILHEVGYSVVLENDHPDITAGELLSTAPDVIITDANNLVAVSELIILAADQYHRKTPTLVLSPSDEIVDIKSAFNNGANGYIPLNDVAQELMEALRTLLAKQLYLGNSLKKTLPDAIIQEILFKDRNPLNTKLRATP